MCGICGIYGYGTGEPVERRVIDEMTAAMVHRGPDDDGHYVEGPLGLGMRRLSIIDLEGGAQPIANEDGTVTVIQNGEIYNFQDLRRDLEAYGHVFRTRSDTEVIVHAYEQWGIDSLARLNGMFGIAIWDERERRLVVARDPFGVKPLYWWQHDGELAFASEIRSLLRHPRVERKVNRDVLGEYLELTFVRAPRTAFEGIEKLLPGHALVVTEEGVRVHRFERTKRRPRTRASEPALVHELREKIERAVRRQMVADVPVGVMLSGGIDSETLATVMTKLRGEPVHTFTVGFEADRFQKNELEAARESSRRIGSAHHDLTISAEGFADFLPTAAWHMEEPVATAQTLPYLAVCELARQHVKVVLTGQGADEPFAGYPRHLGERYGALYRGLPEGLRRDALAPLVARLPRNERLKRAVQSLDVEDPLDRMGRVHSVIDARLAHRLLGGSTNGSVPPPSSLASLLPWRDDIDELDDLNKMLYVDARTSLADNLLMYGDKMSMAVSLEARVPFLDLELMALAESIPADFKIKGRQQKHILKKAMEAWLPPESVNREKVGFETPIDRWLRDDLRGHLEERLLDRESACGQYFERDELRRMIADHASGRQDHKRSLFGLLTFEVWHEQFIRPTRWSGSGPATLGAVTNGGVPGR
jgi:asparagine synthase (glutamine-hydrolysing)